MRVHIIVKGAIYRPPYEGHVDVYPQEPATKADIKWAVIGKLNRTSFSIDRLYWGDVEIKSVEL